MDFLIKNLPTTADALPYLQDADIIGLFQETGVLTPVELESRFEIYAEQYILSIEVEAKLVVDMAKTLIYPAAVNYLSSLTSANAGASAMGISLDDTTTKIVAAEANAMLAAVAELSTAMEKEGFASTNENMQYCATTIRGLMDKVRMHADALECEVADNLWPLPKYQEMLFIK